MNPVLWFVVLALGLSVVVVVGVWWAMARAAKEVAHLDWSRETEVQAPLVQVYREQLADLQAQHDRGELDAMRFAQTKVELEQRLLADVEAESAATSFVATADAPAAPESSKGQSPWVPAQSRGRGLAWSFALLIPIVSVSAYLLLGRPLALVPQAHEAQAPAAEAPASPEQLAQLAQSVRDKLAQDPNQAEGWVMLARVERARGEWQAGLDALSKAQALAPSAEITLERAELLAQQAGRFDGEPWALIRSVLRQDPAHLGALILAGSASMSEGHARDAEGYWTQAQKHMSADSEYAQPLRSAINQAREAQGKPALKEQTADTSPAVGTAQIRVRIDVSPQARAQHQPSDVVFVYAQGPASRMPLAVAKTTLAALPTTVVLDETQGMAQGPALSSAPEVKVTVRISRNGQAVAQAGDWGSSQSAVSTRGQAVVELKIVGPLP